jgi:hypothetical protein
MHHRLRHVALGELGQIEPGTKMRAFAAEHHGAHAFRPVDELGVQGRNQRVVQGVAFFGAHQSEVGHRALHLQGQQIGTHKRLLASTKQLLSLTKLPPLNMRLSLIRWRRALIKFRNQITEPS